MERCSALGVLDSRTEGGHNDSLVKIINLELFLIELVDKLLKRPTLLLSDGEQLGVRLRLVIYVNELANKLFAELIKLLTDLSFRERNH